MLTIDTLAQKGLILMKALSGSRAYGLEVPESDWDVHGVFLSPPEAFFGFSHQDQVSSERNDVVYFELNKFASLLGKNNPSALELLFTPSDAVEIKHPLLATLDPTRVVSKLCRFSFSGYAESQIKRARGLNKKVFHPQMGIPPRPLDFCYAIEEGKTVSLEPWLESRGIKPGHCGLTVLPHVKDGYALYYNANGGYRGLFSPEGMDFCLSSVPKGEKPLTWVVFNKDELKQKSREFREYQEWKSNRNEARYAGTLAHGGGYDTKNLMHTFRLIRMAGEIAQTGVPQVRRSDREELLAIKAGRFTYEDLLDKAETELSRIDALFEASNLRELPDVGYLEEFAVQVRTTLYQR